MKNPKVSIAMATYNGEKFLAEQLDSILRQTFSDFELIVSDDGSSDSTFSILENYQKKDGRIKIFRNEGEHGFAKNFQNALSFCTGDFIAFCDQDDVWSDDHIEHLLSIIGGNFLACANAEITDKDLNPTNVLFMDKIFVTPERLEKNLLVHLFFGNFCQGTALLFKRELLDFLPIPDGMYHDHFFAICAEMAGGISYSPKPILKYRQHENSVVGAGEYISFKEKILNLLKKGSSKRRFFLRKGREIFERMKPKLSEERADEIKKSLNIAKSVTVYKNIFTFKKFFNVIFWDNKTKKFFMRYILLFV